MPPHDETSGAGMIGGDSSTELSANRTAMSFERTAMSTDRTLMSVTRTSLSLIGFGFTIYQTFHTLLLKVPGTLPTGAPKRFGLSLIVLGVILLVLGLLNHWQSTRELRKRRARLFELGLMHHSAPITVSTATAVTMLLLLIGILAFARIIFGTGPF